MKPHLKTTSPRLGRALAIDARPRGPSGPLAIEPIRDRSVLAHLLDAAGRVSGDDPVTIYARQAEHETIRAVLAQGRHDPSRFALSSGPPPENAVVLRADRLYDPAKLRRVVARGRNPETAAIWRLDTPDGLAGAGEEFERRRNYQPLGRYWALAPARALARALRPTRVRPNALTLAAAGAMVTAAGLVGFAPQTIPFRLLTVAALALGLVLDTADGHLARLQGTASVFGRWLDAVLDELCDQALHAAIAWSLFLRSGWAGWLLIGLAYAVGKHMWLVSTTAVPGEPGGEKETPSPLPQPKLGGLARFVRLAGHADLRWHLWIGLAAIGRLEVALAVYAAYFPARTLAAATRKAVHHARA